MSIEAFVRRATGQLETLEAIQAFCDVLKYVRHQSVEACYSRH